MSPVPQLRPFSKPVSAMKGGLLKAERWINLTLGTTSTPYATRQCLLHGELLDNSEFLEIAAVPDWRDARRCHLSNPELVMRHQQGRRGCVDQVLESVLSWSTSRWTEPVACLPPGTATDRDLWRRSIPAAADGFVTADVFTQYFNSLTPELRGGYQLNCRYQQQWDDLEAVLRDLKAPVLVPFLLSPIPRIGRVVARMFLAATMPVNLAVYWTTMALGQAGYHWHREAFLAGDDDVNLFYPHLSIVVGLFRRRRDGQEFVLLLEPWGGDVLLLSGMSQIFEVLTREEFERRWCRWEQLKLSPKLRARLHRMILQGGLFTLTRQNSI
ncbi:MAG: hypothetical protein R3C59_26245 [Planctomycetaceae bacterium]